MNVGCMHATIYYSYHKETRLLQLSYIWFYWRLIDDAFVAIRDDDSCYYSLLRHMNDFGPRGKRLEWEATKAGFSVDFLDKNSINRYWRGVQHLHVPKRKKSLLIPMLQLSLTTFSPLQSRLRYSSSLFLAKYSFRGFWQIYWIFLAQIGSRSSQYQRLGTALYLCS